MYTKLFTLLLMVCLIGTLNYATSNDRYKTVKIVANGDALRGDTGPIVYGPPAPRDLSALAANCYTVKFIYSFRFRDPHRSKNSV